jgi:hypothetical protein
MNQSIILGIFIWLWGVFCLVRPKDNQRLRFGLVTMFLGLALILGALTAFPSNSLLGGFFFALSLLVSALLTGFLLVNLPSFDSRDLSLTLIEQDISSVSLTGFGQMLGLFKTTNQNLEESGFGQQILLMFLFLVLLLLMKLV